MDIVFGGDHGALSFRGSTQKCSNIYAEARYQKFKKDYDTSIQNEGITLTDLQVQKVALAFMLAERVMFTTDV